MSNTLSGQEVLTSATDQELDYAESLLIESEDPDERDAAASLIITTVTQAFGERWYDQGHQTWTLDEPRHGLRRSVHPDMPGNATKDAVIEDYQANATRRDFRVLDTPDRRILEIDQGSVWEVPYGPKPYAFAGLSSCSLLVGYGSDGMAVGHVAFSETDATDVVLKFFEDKGISPGNTYVVASLSHEEQSWSAKALVDDQQYYEDRGIPASHILPVRYTFEPGENGQLGVYHDVAMVVATDSYIAVRSLDQDTSGRELAENQTKVMSVR
ncbi:MAG TPA: hypothetical protein VK694_02560 [Verrucomicrobiae bacterium]|nr:hypothetical protein [Verrucomicrobiae bacterium]